MFYSHTKPDRPINEWESLEAHLHDVADLSEQFGGKFGFPSIARQIGLWHDLGKYSAAFQDYLKKAGEVACEDDFSEKLLRNQPKVDHSTPGAKFAFNQISSDSLFSLVRYFLAYAISGHHAGMPDLVAETGQSGLLERLRKRTEPLNEIPPDIAKNSINLSEFRGFKPVSNRQGSHESGFQFSFLNRMLFSSLVDADFLATERFMKAEALERPVHENLPEWDRLSKILANHVDSRSKSRREQLDDFNRGKEILDYRDALFQACVDSSSFSPGFYQLQAPVGTGKTLASLAFAVNHANHHSLDRIIYAIPFTSIVDQTASEFRSLAKPMGPHFLIEHHSNLLAINDTTENRLLSENWDAPLVVTTNVQLFESLFSNRPSQCRKLHRISRSVLILDEAQTIPPSLLIPCLKALEELVRNYNVTVLICSATPPALIRTDHFPFGLNSLKDVTGIVNKTHLLPRRVQSNHLGRLTIDELADRLVKEPNALCIVNTRPMAHQLFYACWQRLDEKGRERLFHLSTWICGEHRRHVLNEIKTRLNGHPAEPALVISTQVVEAGVDIDFPVVFRAMAGLDSIAQASGRCNREGKTELGMFYLFEPAELNLHGYLGMTIANAREVLVNGADPLDPQTVCKYFEMSYWKLGHELDKERIYLGDYFITEQLSSDIEARFKFRTVARKFRMIDDSSSSIIVPFGIEGENLVSKIQRMEKLSLLDWRKLQRYSVSVHSATLEKLVSSHAVLVQENYPPVLINRLLYNEKLGLDFVHQRPEYLPAEEMVL